MGRISYLFLLLCCSVVFGGVYPDGPELEGQPILDSFEHPLVTCFIVFFSFSIGYLIVYALLRTLIENFFGFEQDNSGYEDLGDVEMQNVNNAVAGGSAIPEEETARPVIKRQESFAVGKETAARLDAVDKFYVQGYKSWIPGYIAFFALWLYCAWMVTLFFLLMFEVYWGCQTGGLDNQCYYGTKPFTGGKLRKMFTEEFYYWYWWQCLGSLSILLAIREYVSNWFRLTTTLENADYVYVWVRDEDELLCVDPTFFVIWSRKLQQAIKDMIGQTEEGHGETVPSQILEIKGQKLKYLEFEFTRYIIKGDGLNRVAVDMSDQISELATMTGGLDEDGAATRLLLIGKNEIGYRVDNLWQLFRGEFFQYFYVYQWQVYLVWFYWAYLFTACAEYSVVLLSAVVNMTLKHYNQTTIAQLTAFESTEIVWRAAEKGGKLVEKTVNGKDLVPGDLIKIRSGEICPCDILLMEGTCVLDEAGLTGESMPIAKVAADENSDKTYGEHSASRNTLFAGTTILQAGSSKDDVVKGMVMRTGISTEKGELVSHILAPGKMTFKYDEEYVIAVMLLLLWGSFCFAMTLVFKDMIGSNMYWVTRFNTSMFTVSQMLSPLLPLSLSIGQAASATRLSQTNNIFCVNPKRIAICGKIRLVAFDKTGTLTKEGLDFLGSVQIEDNNGALVLGEETLEVGEEVKGGLVTCHAVTKFGDKYVGNQVEVQMFKSTGWDLIEKPGESPQVSGDGRTVTIPRRFEFDHARMTMSVITESEEQGRIVYCKGAAEKIAELCIPESLPDGFIEEAEQWARDGAYVLGLCCKVMDEAVDIHDYTRDDVEEKQSFKCLGLILFRNELKEDTAEAMAQLKGGDCRTIMITGDNAQCGYYIAKESGMIAKDAKVYLADVSRQDSSVVVWKRQDGGKRTPEESTGKTEELNSLPSDAITDKGTELAMTGKAFDILERNGELDNLILKTRIYARASPNQKTLVIRKLIEKGIVCGYCGDGGNDCGALRAAHAGLALSEAEASVVAPFTGKDKSVMDMVNLLREGRCALATSFAVWKFILSFGQSYIICKLSYVYFDAILPSIDYIFIDLIAEISISFALTLSRPLDKLGPDRPTASLLGPITVMGVLGQFFINLVFACICWAVVVIDDDYNKWPIKCEDGNSWWLMGDNWEAFNCMNIFIFQIFTAGFVFGFGSRFRKPIWENYGLLFVTFMGYLVFTLLLLLPESAFTKAFHYPQTNYNRYRSDSTTWNMYQNVNEDGIPVFGADTECAYWAVSPDHVWNIDVETTVYKEMSYCTLMDNSSEPLPIYRIETHSKNEIGIWTVEDGCFGNITDEDGDVVNNYTLSGTESQAMFNLTYANLISQAFDATEDGPVIAENVWDGFNLENDHTGTGKLVAISGGGRYLQSVGDADIMYFNMDMTLNNDGEFRPGQESNYDQCVHSACWAVKKGCKCGARDDVNFEPQDSDYDMSFDLRFKLFIIVFFNNLCDIIFVWQALDGVGRDYFKTVKPDYIFLDL